MLPCQRAPLLPFVTQEQNVMEYRHEGSTSVIPPISASDVMGHHRKIGGVTFGEATVCGHTVLVLFYFLFLILIRVDCFEGWECYDKETLGFFVMLSGFHEYSTQHLQSYP